MAESSTTRARRAMWRAALADALGLASSHPHYLWVNRTFCFGVGQSYPERQEVAYDVYGVS